MTETISDADEKGMDVMRTAKRVLGMLTIACAGVLLVPADAHAYIGPGVGISAIGTAVALLGAVLFAIVGFVWYPVRRLLAVVRNRSGNGHEAKKASVS